MKKNFTSKVVAVITAVVFTIGLAGCQGNGNIKPAETIKPQVKEVTITFPTIWVGKDSKAKMVGELISQFNQKNSGKIKVAVEEIADYNSYSDKMRTNIAAGVVPDIFSFDNMAMAPVYFKSGKLLDFTAYMNKGWKDNFLPDAISAVTYDSKIMAVPFEFGVTPVLYNSRLLAKVGVTEFPKTYTEFFAMCEKLKAQGIIPMSQMTGENAWTSMLWYSQLVASIGGPDVYKRGFDDPAFLEAAKIMIKMFDYTTKDAIGATAAIAAGHFLNERTAMLLNGPWFIGRIKKEGINNMYDEVKVAPAPYYEGGKGKQGAYVGFIQACIAAAKQTDKTKEEAVATFLQFFTKPDNVKKISMDSGSMFVVKFDIKPEDKGERLQAQMVEQTNKAPYVIPHFVSFAKPATTTNFPMALSAMLLGKTTPEQFIEEIKKTEAQQ